MCGLAGKFLRRCSAFLRIGCIRLRDLVDLRQTLTDLLNALRLFIGGAGDLGNQVCNFGNPIDDFGALSLFCWRFQYHSRLS